MSSPYTANHHTIRRHNASLVLNQLRLNAPLSRADLAKRIGLNRSTVSSIVAQLLAEDLIVETEFRTDMVGRPGLLLELNSDGGCAVGIEIGSGNVHVLLLDLTGHVLWRRRIRIGTGEGQETYLHIAEEMIRQAITFADNKILRVFGVGLAMPGMVDTRQGKLRFAPNLRWRDMALGEQWSARFDAPVIVENNANAGAFAEYYLGATHDVTDFIYLGGDTGIGGGIVVDGELLRGSGGFAGELGHMTIVPGGELCGCGKYGCWETVAGPRAVVADYERRANAIGSGARLDAGQIDMVDLADAAAMNDLAASIALNEAARFLGIGIANLVNIFNPQLIILGGILGQVSDALIPGIRDIVREESLFPMRDSLTIMPSQHGTDDCVMGAAALVLDSVLREPDLR